MSAAAGRQNLALIDRRVEMALEGRERTRGVITAIASSLATVRLAGQLLPATSGGWPVRAGDVVELERPRGLGGALRVVAIVQRSLPDVPTPVDGQQGHVLLVGSDLSLSWGSAGSEDPVLSHARSMSRMSMGF